MRISQFNSDTLAGTVQVTLIADNGVGSVSIYGSALPNAKGDEKAKVKAAALAALEDAIATIKAA